MPPSSLPGLRQQILAAARRLFIEKGYHGLSMRQIAEAVGVSKAALYYHFEDKEELFLAVLEAHVVEAEAIIDEAQIEGRTARDRIRLIVQAIFDQPAEQRAIIRLASQEMALLEDPARLAFRRVYQDRFIDRIQGILETGIRNGELRALDPRLATWCLLGMMYPYFYPAYQIEMPPVSEVIEQLLEIYLDGIAK